MKPLTTFALVGVGFVATCSGTAVGDWRPAAPVPRVQPAMPVSGVPEPAQWALMMAGMGGVGLVLRRQRGGAPR